MKRLLLFAMAIIFAMQLSAQSFTVVVGDSTTTTTNSYVPLYTTYENSFTESLYPASELMPGTITSISYYQSSSGYNNGTIKIYMKEVDQSSITSFVVGSDFTEVYTGPANIVSGRNTYELTTPFIYTGGGNLLVAVIRDGTSWGGSVSWKKATVGSAVYDYDDGEEYFITTVPSGTSTVTGAPVVKFEMESLGDDFCYPPQNLSYSGLEQTGVTINWEAMNENNTTFGLAYKTVDEEEWTTASENITDLSYTLTGLDSYAHYQVKVWTVCDAENSGERSIDFWTLPTEDQMITIPYEQNFDDLEDLSSWELWTVTQSGTTQWYLGALGAHAEEGEEGQGLYISNDNGVTNAYNPDGDACVAHLSTLINLEDDTYYGVEFDYKAVGELGYDEVVVSLFPLGAALPTSNSIPAANLIGRSNDKSNEWTRVTIPVPNDMPRGAYQLVISWRNDGSVGENPPASIDNLYIFSTSCARVNEFTTTMEDAGSSVTMNVEVTDELNEDAEYIVSYRYAGDTTWYQVEGTSPIAVTDLPYSSRVDYKVTANCGGSELAVTSSTFTDWTTCNTISEYPYVENFDVNGFISIQDSARANKTSLHCWYNVNGGYEYYYWSGISSGSGLPVTVDTTTSNSNALYFSGTSSSSSTDNFSDWMISPVFEMTGNDRLNFQYKTSSSTNAPVIDVYVLDVNETDYSAMADTANFTLLTSINASGLATSTWHMAEVFLNEYSGNIRLALAVRQPSSTFYIDNFTISEIPDCPDVHGLVVTPGYQTAYVSYNTANIGEDGVTLAYAEIAEGEEFDPESAQTVSISAEETLPFIIEELTTGSTYAFAAQQACGGAWTTPVTITMPIMYPIPASFDFDTEETTPQMQYSQTTVNAWAVGTAENNTVDEYGDPTGGGALYISNDNGQTVGYNSSTYTSGSYVAIPFAFDPAAEINISFDWKCEGDYSSPTTTAPYDYMQVFIAPYGQSLSSGQAISAKLFASSQWQTTSIALPGSEYAGGYNLIFKWYNNYSGTDGIPGVVDNVVVVANSCTSTSLETTVAFVETEESETGGAFVVNMTDDVNTDVTYVLRYKESANSEWTEIPELTIDDFPYTINGINFQTIYNVQTGVMCQDAETPSYATQINVTTPCQSLPTPWFEDFGNSSMFNSPSCWERYSGQMPASGQINTSALTSTTLGWSVASRNFGGNNTTLTANIYSSYKYWAVSPTIDLGDGSTILQVAFDLAVTDYYNSNPPEEPSPDDKFMLLVSLDNGASWNTANGLVFADGDEDTEHNYADLTNVLQRYAYKLVDENDEPLTGQVRFAIYGESTVSNADNDVVVDNLTVEPWSECPMPYGLSVSGIQSSQATVSYTTWGPATTWEYAVAEADENGEADLDGADAVQIITNDPITVTELNPNTDYVFGIRSICEGDVASPWATASFRTLPAAEMVPYSTTLDDPDDLSTWTIISNATNNVWAMGTATAADDGGSAVYVSNDGGETYGATLGTSTSRSFFYKDFTFGEEPQDYELSFDWKATGRINEQASVYCGIMVYLLDIAPISTSSNPSSTYRKAIVYGSEEWKNEKVILSQVSGDKRLVFVTWGYTNEAELTTPAAIDNITIDFPTCTPPDITSVDVTNLTSTSATVNWVDPNESNSTWNVYYKQVMDAEYQVVSSATQSAELTELVPDMLYLLYVTTDCGSGESAHTTIISFRTECAPSSAPWSEDFTTSVTSSQCWSREVGTLSENVVFTGSTSGWSTSQDAIGGNTTGKVYNNIWMGDEADWLITPQIDLGEDGDLYEVSFDVAISAWGSSGGAPDYDASGVLAVVASADGGSTWSNATALIYQDGDDDTEHNFTDLTNTFQTVTYLLQDENGDPLTGIIKVGLYVAKTVDNGADNNVYIDNLSIYVSDQEPGGNPDPDPEPEPCDAPTALAASNITQTSADITWNGTASTYELKVNGGAAETLTTTSKALTGLTANTAYTVEVRAVCEDAESDWVTTTFTTLQEQGGTDPEPCDAPTNLTANNITETTANITWNGTASTYEFKLNGGTAETLTTTTKALTGLTANTAYTVEVRAICGEQQSAWVSATFTTLEEVPEIVAPVVTTIAATGVDHQSAILNGTITAGSETITAQGFKYKATAAADWTTVSATGTTISAVVNGLTEQTTYIFKAYATTASGTVEGNEMTFTTTAAPVVVVLGEVTTTPATNVGNTSATLNGALVSAGESENFTVGFALATVADFTLEDNNVQNITATLNANTFSQAVNDLVEGQTYFYRAYITNEAGTAYGTVETFTLSGLNDAIAGMLQATIYPNPAQDNA
ncbi:MAG: fibronectin type III domain-containing protein, partial [Bacteroidales bacterium]|nr:fibronectin type III domain-containing protein [Bacteroidales bacterium]